jgi:hypothetical protein
MTVFAVMLDINRLGWLYTTREAAEKVAKRINKEGWMRADVFEQTVYEE